MRGFDQGHLGVYEGHLMPSRALADTASEANALCLQILHLHRHRSHVDALVLGTGEWCYTMSLQHVVLSLRDEWDGMQSESKRDHRHAHDTKANALRMA